MTYAEIITKFKEHTSGLADDLTDAEVVSYLNRFYQHNLPAAVDGNFSEIIWSETLSAPPSVGFVIPSYVTAVRNKCWLLGPSDVTNIKVSRDFQRFITDWPDYNTVGVEGKPVEVCLYGDQVFLNIRTDVAYTFRFMARGGPSSQLGTASVLDDPHGMAVVTGAAWDFLNEKEDTDGTARELAQYDRYLSMLRTRSKQHHQPRRLVRSF